MTFAPSAMFPPLHCLPSSLALVLEPHLPLPARAMSHVPFTPMTSLYGNARFREGGPLGWGLDDCRDATFLLNPQPGSHANNTNLTNLTSHAASHINSSHAVSHCNTSHTLSHRNSSNTLSYCNSSHTLSRGTRQATPASFFNMDAKTVGGGGGLGNVQATWNLLRSFNPKGSCPTSNEWCSYAEQGLPQSNHRLRDMSLCHTSNVSSRFRAQYSNNNIQKKLTGGDTSRSRHCFPSPYANASENYNQDNAASPPVDYVRVSPLNRRSRDLNDISGDTKETQEIRHSIREILKPRENRRFSKDHHGMKSRKNRTSDSETRIRRYSKNGNHVCQSMEESQSDLVACSEQGQNTRDEFHVKVEHEVISVFTMAKSSVTQSIDLTSLKPSKKSKTNNPTSFDILGSAFIPDLMSDAEYGDAHRESPPLERAGHQGHGHGHGQGQGQSERKTFQCPQCRYLTDRKNNLKRHIVTMHQDSGKTLECCGIPFQSKASLRDHNSVFHRGGYRCQICARNFCRKALLRRHLSVHSGQKDFFCELCGYATSHKSNLERHQKVHARRTTGESYERAKRSCVINVNVKATSLVNDDNMSDESRNDYVDDVHANVRVINDDGANDDDGGADDDDFDDDDDDDDGDDDDLMSATGHRRYYKHARKSETVHSYDIVDSSYRRDVYQPSHFKRKRARFFTSRIQETYSEPVGNYPHQRAGNDSPSVESDEEIMDLDMADIDYDNESDNDNNNNINNNNNDEGNIKINNEGDNDDDSNNEVNATNDERYGGEIDVEGDEGEHISEKVLRTMAAIQNGGTSTNNTADYSTVQHVTPKPSDRSSDIALNDDDIETSSDILIVQKYEDATDNKTTKYEDATDNITTKYGDATDNITAKYGDATCNKTTKYGDATDIKTTKYGDATDNKTTKYGDAADNKTTKYGDATDIKTTKHLDETKLVAGLKMGNGECSSTSASGTGSYRVSRKRRASDRRSRMFRVSYQCDECGQKLPSQPALQSHACPRTLACQQPEVSLVTALQKGCLKYRM